MKPMIAKKTLWESQESNIRPLVQAGAETGLKRKMLEPCPTGRT